MEIKKNNLTYLSALEYEEFFKVPDSSKSNYDQIKKLNQEDPFAPDLLELDSLSRIISITNRTTILEFGCGWSSLVFAAALCLQKNKHGDISYLRRTHAYECHSVDNSKKYIKQSKQRIPSRFLNHISLHFSEVHMCSWNGRFATEYANMPVINPDLIYIDAPSQFGIKGKINNFNTEDHDLLPMSCDILKLEYFLLPYTLIIIDGRAANTRFIKNNLQRNWKYKHCPNRDQHFFLLEEKPLGKLNERLINDHYFKYGNWNIEDL